MARPTGRQRGCGRNRREVQISLERLSGRCTRGGDARHALTLTCVGVAQGARLWGNTDRHSLMSALCSCMTAVFGSIVRVNVAHHRRVDFAPHTVPQRRCGQNCLVVWGIIPHLSHMRKNPNSGPLTAGLGERERGGARGPPCSSATLPPSSFSQMWSSPPLGQNLSIIPRVSSVFVLRARCSRPPCRPPVTQFLLFLSASNCPPQHRCNHLTLLCGSLATSRKNHCFFVLQVIVIVFSELARLRLQTLPTRETVDFSNSMIISSFNS